MSLSAEYCEEKASNRDGGALAQQRKLICGLLVWSTLLTLGLAASIIYVQLMLRASQDHAKPEANSECVPCQNVTLPRGNSKDTENNLITFQPNWGHIDLVEQLRWNTMSSSFISRELTVHKDGYYFLYLQVTLGSVDTEQKYEVTVEVIQQPKPLTILSSHISKTKPSTGLMGRGMPLAKGVNITVTCKPKAKIKIEEKDTYLGVIKIG